MLGAVETLGEHAKTLAVAEVVALTADYVALPIAWLFHPTIPVEEHRCRNHDAANHVVTSTGGSDGREVTPIALDSRAQRVEVGGTVLDAERVPSEPSRQDAEAREVAKAGDGVVRMLQPEEERRACLDCAER